MSREGLPADRVSLENAAATTMFPARSASPRVALADPKVLLKVDDTACARVVACGAGRERKAAVVQSEGIWDPFTEFEDSRERALLRTALRHAHLVGAERRGSVQGWG